MVVVLDPRKKSSSEVAVATVQGRAYYHFTGLLKKLGIPFESIVPGEKIPEGVKLVLTTGAERKEIVHPKVLSLGELSSDRTVATVSVLRAIHGDESPLLMGIDPGKRTGFVMYYRNFELESRVFSEMDDLLSRVEFIVGALKGEKIVRVGGGDLSLSNDLTAELRKRLGRRADLELVDEKGTSSPRPRVGGRATRDQLSARLIAFRKGMKIHPEW